ncbi:MAG: DNA cytosine methyltransferase [Novosphingobium sp.]|nr:DNA cytosine methyltransferase [Novosphingobium sp.]MBO9603089.1 DNA cytosine methyltransferase [Novosphingobium sp.]
MNVLAVDLFSGGGGLTVGLKSAGFTVHSAVEKDLHAAATYRVNHPEVKLIDKDIRDVSADDIRPGSDLSLSLIAGCPPCQGFTSLTSKYKRDDPRNSLIAEMERLVLAAQPAAVMMENVPGLVSKGREKFEEFVKRLRNAGYKVDWDILQVADYGTPQLRRRLVLLAGKEFRIGLPKATHSRTGSNDTTPWRKVSEVIKDLPPAETFTSRPLLHDGAIASEWHRVRRLSSENLERLRWAKPGGNWMDIPEHHRPACHRGKYRGFSNVYGRLAWDQTAPTMTGGCTTLSKGRFGHPSELRTISVYEAALFQEFPKDYRIATPFMDKACDIIGNALPCGFAAAMARQVIKALGTTGVN